jgi:hypothetical protein
LSIGNADVLDPLGKANPSEWDALVNRTRLPRFRGHLAVPIRRDRSVTAIYLEIEKWYLPKFLFSYSSRLVLQLLM